MIAYLCRSIPFGRAIAERELGLVGEWSQLDRRLYRSTQDHTPCGMLVARPEDLGTLELAGLVMLETVSTDLAYAACGRLRTALFPAGTPAYKPELDAPAAAGI